MLRAILFDLDDTLVDHAGAVCRFLDDLAEDSPLLADKARWRGRLLQYVTVDSQLCSMLQELARRYTLAVVSNGSRRMQRGKILRAGLSGLFDRVFISGEMGVRKPDNAIFRRAIDTLACGADEAMFVGNDPVADIAGAAAAGLKTCWISHGETFPPNIPEPDCQLTTVLDLPKVLPCLTPTN